MARQKLSLFKRAILMAMLPVIIFSGLFSAPRISAVPADTRSSAPVFVAQATNTAAPTTGTPTATPTASPGGLDGAVDQTQDPDQTCESSVGGMGWILCQIFRWTYDVFSWLIYNVMGDKLLKIDLTDTEEPLRNAWSGFLTFANLIFIIVFLIIIYGEATHNFGILEKYSAKRLIPRLAFAVIAAQLSFIVTTYLVGLFNDIGSGVAQVVLAPVNGLEPIEVNGIFSHFVNDDSFFGLQVAALGFDNILFGALAVGGLFLGAIALATALETGLLFGMIGLFVLFAVLVVRRVIILAMILVAPIAFALYVLPGTEKFFQQWWDTLIKALMMYPIIMLFVATGNLIGRLIVAGDNSSIVDTLIGMFAVFLPLFLVTTTFSLAGKAMGTFSAALRKVGTTMAGNPNNPTSARNKARERGALRRDDWLMGRTGSRIGRAIANPAVRTVWKRLPLSDVGISTANAVKRSRDWVMGFVTTQGDSAVHAITMTGGGIRRGHRVSVQGAGGNPTQAWSGRLKWGSHFARDENGQIIHRDGMAVLASGMTGRPLIGEDGQYKVATTKDFYSREDMARSRREVGGDWTRLQAAAEYSLQRSQLRSDHMRVLEGVQSSDQPKAIKSGIMGGLGYYGRISGSPDLKYLDYEMRGGAQRELDTDGVGLAQHTGIRMDKADEFVQFVASDSQHYDASKWSGAVWDSLSKVIADPSLPVDVGEDHPRYQTKIILDDIAGRATSLIDSVRATAVAAGGRPPLDDQGRPLAGQAESYYQASPSTIFASQQARAFLEAYRAKFGGIPTRSSVDREIVPPPAPPRP